MTISSQDKKNPFENNLEQTLQEDFFASDKKIALILVAAGSSTRMGKGVKKEYLPLENGTVLSTCLKKFINSLELSSIVITYPKKHFTKNANFESEEKNNFTKNNSNLFLEMQKSKDAIFCDKDVPNNLKIDFIEGGTTRQESVLNALNFLAKIKNQCDFVIIHDGARPFITKNVILQTLKAAFKYKAAAPGLTPTDTQKSIDKNGFIKKHLNRSLLFAIQTPQIFEFKKLYFAHKKAKKDKKEYTDDTEIWGKYCGKVKTVQGNPENKKITYKDDYFYNQNDNFQKNTQNSTNKIKIQEKNLNQTENTKMNNFIIKTGLGYDLHKLVEGRKLIIGGIEIPFEKGEDGHSDADVLLHAITDALLGASSLGDIGSYFPPEDEKWKNANSVELLKIVWRDIQNEGWKLNNLDCVIKLEKPKFLPFRQKVIESIANALECSKEKIFVKAKTGEKLDSVGKGEAIEAWCSCILIK